jgi:hypothetical protein
LFKKSYSGYSNRLFKKETTMPILTITPTDLKYAGLNILVGAAHKIIGGAVAYGVIQIARRVFNVDYCYDNTKQKLERAAILMSCIISYYVASQTPLKNFSFRKAIELYLLEVILNVGCKHWIDKSTQIFIPSILGTLGGNLGGAWLGYLSGHIGGRTGQILMSIMGAQSYANMLREDYWSNDEREPFYQRFLADGKK